MNNSVILDTEYQQQIRHNIKETIQINKEANPNTLWEIIKSTIRNTTIKYTSGKKKQDIKQEQKLKNEIKEIEKQISKTTNQGEIEQLKIKLNETKIELDSIIEAKVNGILIRAKAQAVEYNEKNSSYFSNLEKKRAESKTITRLNVNGKDITNQSDIRSAQHHFYSNLYKKKRTESSTINFFNDSIKKLNQNNKLKCEGKLTEYECANALKQMQNSKSPGSDGISTEFYKIFWNDIKQHYMNSINHSFDIKNLTELQKQGLITLLPKPDKDVAKLANWRPICLLNIDYKIATKAISNRLKLIINDIIDSSQTGFIKGRYIGENIRLLTDIIDNVNDKNLPGILFFSDFEKAFDSLDHDFMIKCLKHLNFGDEIIKWIELFYTDAQNAILNNGHLTDFFKVERGVRQGCPLSPYIFIICVELLSFEINNNNNIKGQTLAGEEIKRTLFADDATFILDGSKRSFENLIHTLDNYSLISGLKLNESKCYALG